MEVFYWHEETFPSDSDRVKTHKRLAQQARERMEFFKPLEPGIFSAFYTESAWNEDVKCFIPLAQLGYEDLKERVGERQRVYMNLSKCSDVRFPLILRRSVKLTKMMVPDWIAKLENDFSKSYPFSALKKLEKTKPYLLPQKLDSSNEGSIQFIRDMLVICPLMEMARVQQMIRRLNGRVTIKRTEQTSWLLFLPLNVNENSLMCAEAATGCWAYLSSNNSERCRLLVGSLRNNNALLLRPGTLDQLDSSMFVEAMRVGNTVDCHVRFVAPTVAYNLAYTATVDALSAMPDVFLQPTMQPLNGARLIATDQMIELRQGLGFRNTLLDENQRRAVVNALLHERPFTPFSLIGPPGTGKTNVIDEIIYQVVHFTLEARPCDAIIHVTMPSNNGVAATMRRLVEKGIPVDCMVRVLADQAPVDRLFVDNTQHVTNFYPRDEYQVILGTPLAIGRMSMMRTTKLDGTVVKRRPPLVVVCDEVASLTVGVTYAATITNGEPVAMILCGDPRQIAPRCVSKANALMYGSWTVFDALGTSPWYIKNKNTYELHEDAGVNLTINYRATPYLTKVVSNIFYNGLMVSPVSLGDDRKHYYLDSLQKVSIFRNVTKPLIWVSVQGECTINPPAMSRSNFIEAQKVADMSIKIGKIIGQTHLCVISPYRDQVALIKKLSGGTLDVSTVDDIQGHEKDVVIVSLVRSTLEMDRGHKQSIGFLQTKNRINVMMSRAKCMCIIVGDSEKFANSGIDFWLEILEASEFSNMI